MPGRVPLRGLSWRAAIGLAAAVLLLHGTILDLLGSAFRTVEPGRLPQTIYTRLLHPTPPPAAIIPAPAAPAPAPEAVRTRPIVAPAPARRAVRHAPHAAVSKTEPPRPVASTPVPAPIAPPAAALARPASAASDSAPPPAAASAPMAAGSSAAPATTAPVPAAPAPNWPPPTRLSYAITGHWRGPLYGSGSLVWQRDGGRYELTLSGSALIWFSYRSIGRIDGDWLAPQRYEERVINRVKTVEFHRGQQLLGFSAIPAMVPLRPHVQDSASLLMQLAHLLATEPQAFRNGGSITFAVARPTGMTDWTFRISGLEPISTGVGSLQCWHIRRESTNPDDLGVQIWLAPQLQNLPVQIRLQRSRDSYLLFTLDRAEQ